MATTETKLVAKSSLSINATSGKVWEALLNPVKLQTIMLGMKPVSDWKVGSELRWIGRHAEKPNDNAKGTIEIIDPARKFQFTFYYPGYGYPDIPENYNTVLFILSETGATTLVTVEQGDFAVFKEGETFRGHSQNFWEASLKILKAVAEG